MIHPQPIRVMVVDKSAAVREGLETFLRTYEEFVFVGAASNGVEAVIRAGKFEPDILMLDLSASDAHLDSIISALRRVCSTMKIVTFCSPDQEEHAINTLKAGAIGYVLTNIAADDLRKALLTFAKKNALAKG